MTSLGLTGQLFQDRPDPETAILFARRVGQDLGGLKGGRYFVISEHVVQGDRVRSGGNPRGIHLLQYIEVLQYVGKLLAESLQISLVYTQTGKTGDMLYFLCAQFQFDTSRVNRLQEHMSIISLALGTGNSLPRRHVRTIIVKGNGARDFSTGSSSPDWYMRSRRYH
jgi:hypothetical protein